jgi:hypothetical protein
MARWTLNRLVGERRDLVAAHRASAGRSRMLPAKGNEFGSRRATGHLRRDCGSPTAGTQRRTIPNRTTGEGTAKPRYRLPS